MIYCLLSNIVLCPFVDTTCFHICRCRQCEPWAHMCGDCLCVHNSLAMHDIEIWDEFEQMYADYSALDSGLLSPGDCCIPSVQTTSGRRKNVNLRGNLSLPILLGRGIFPSNPKRITRCISRPFLDLCSNLTEIGAVSQTNLQRVFTGGVTPDHDVFNETFLLYRVIARELLTRLFERVMMKQPPSGNDVLSTYFFTCVLCVHLVHRPPCPPCPPSTLSTVHLPFLCRVSCLFPESF